MKIGISQKSGIKGFVNQHHILPRRLTKDSTKTIKLTLDEHASVHQFTSGINDKDSLLGVFYFWITDKIFD